MSKVNLKKTIGPIAGIIIFLLACGAIYLLIHKDTNSSQSSNYSPTDTSNRSYTSVKHGFSINFPGDPTVSNSYLLFKQAGRDISVPFTTYKRDDGNALYQVIIYEYPSVFDMSDIDARLKAAINSSVQNFKSASLVSSKFGQFAGHRSINGVISVNSDGTTLDVYDTAFLKGNTLYLLLTVDANQTAFNSFASTFQLNKKQ